MSIATELTKLQTTKANIKQALVDKGQTPTDQFDTYPNLIKNIGGIPSGTTFGYSRWETLPQEVIDYAKNGTYGADLFYSCNVTKFSNVSITLNNLDRTFQNFTFNTFVGDTNQFDLIITNNSSEVGKYTFANSLFERVRFDKLPGYHTYMFMSSNVWLLQINDMTGFLGSDETSISKLRGLKGENFGKGVNSGETIDLSGWSNLGVNDSSIEFDFKTWFIYTVVTNSATVENVTLKLSTNTKALLTDEDKTTLTTKGYTIV